MTNNSCRNVAVFSIAMIMSICLTACGKDSADRGGTSDGGTSLQSPARMTSISRIIGYRECYQNDTLYYTVGQMLIPSSNTDRLSFIWSGNRLSAAEFGNWLSASFVYNGGNNLTDCFISRSDGEPGTVDQYKKRHYHMVYESAFLSRVEVIDFLNSSFHQTYSITNTSDGRITSIVSTDGISHHFTWQGDNVIQHEQFRTRSNGAIDTIIVRYEYDNTTSIYTGMSSLMWVLMDEELGLDPLTTFNEAQLLSRNNMTKAVSNSDGSEEEVDVDPVPDKSSGLLVNYHHQNSNGYVLKTEASCQYRNDHTKVITCYTYDDGTAAYMPPVYHVDVQSNMDASTATTTFEGTNGGGDFEEGMQIAIYAHENVFDNVRFVEWDDGNTDNPRYITVTGDASYTAILE